MSHRRLNVRKWEYTGDERTKARSVARIRGMLKHSQLSEERRVAYRHELRELVGSLRRSMSARNVDYDALINMYRERSNLTNNKRKKPEGCMCCGLEGHETNHKGAHFPNRGLNDLVVRAL
jgi:hypothetical protein